MVLGKSLKNITVYSLIIEKLQKNNKNITISIRYIVRFFRKKVYKMIKFIRMWKSINMSKENKRNIKEVDYYAIDLNEYMIIDVRSRREFIEKHLDGAINIPLPEVKKNIEKYVNNKKRKILMCCEYGGRSAKATQILEQLGYVNVFNLKGGLEKI